MTLEEAINNYYRLIYSLVYGSSGKDKEFTDECCNDIFFLFWLKAENKLDDVPYWLSLECNTREQFEEKIILFD